MPAGQRGCSRLGAVSGARGPEKVRPGALHPPSGYQPTQWDSKNIPGRTRMKPGDTCEVEITGLGVLRNPIVADPTPHE